MLDVLEVAREKGLEEGKVLGVQEGKLLGVQEGKVLGVQEGKALGVQEGKALGVQEGKALGVQEGKGIGMLEATRNLLLDALIEKFGVMPSRISRKIRAMENQDALEALFRQVFRCAELAEFEAILERVE